MPKDQSTWTLSDTARASNPGKLRVNPFRWFTHYPVWPLIWFLGLCVWVIFAVLVHWIFWIPAVLFLGMNWFYWQRVREHFQHGCANPGMVISLDPMLIAVSTDLSMGIGNYPVIKIIEKDLATVCGKPPKVGSLLAAVALYHAQPREDLRYWDDFDPRPVDCATGNLEKIRHIMRTFDQETWQELKFGLAQVPRPFEPGLYHVEGME